jgi:hypothetical protein
MTSISTPARAFGGPLDLGVAALAAVSTGFVAFAMPEDLFSAMVSASHLPDLVAAAAPPLGNTARYAVMGAGAALAFLVSWSLLRALDGSSAPRSARPTAKQAEPDAPRVRRADFHPDAPARRPLFAGADLGEPDVYELDTLETNAAMPAEPAPSEFDLEPFAAAEPAPPAGRLPRFMAAEDEEPVPHRNPVVPPAQKMSDAPLALRLPEQPTESSDSIGSLMSRLERGLGEREEPVPVVEPDLPAPLAAASANPEASLSQEGVRHRLRSAISELNQRASGG